MKKLDFFKDKNFYVKFEDDFNEELGQYPKDRSINDLLDRGFINIDKDAGPTSHQVADYLNKLLDCSKTGHSGTLDPQVTGVLLCGLGRATRLMEYMLKSNKEYVCLAFFHKEITKEQILSVFKDFTGEIMQLPPIVSAVKRELRPRTIYSIELLDIAEDNKHVLFRVACQHGTYIRKLCTDMGERIGINAQMKELRRSKAGPMREENNIVSLDKLRNLWELYEESPFGSPEKKKLREEIKKYIRPQEELLREFKSVILRDAAVNTVAHGTDLAVPGVLACEENIEVDEIVAMYTQKGELVGMGEAQMSTKDVKENSKGIAFKIQKVFIDRDYYPKFEKNN